MCGASVTNESDARVRTLEASGAAFPLNPLPLRVSATVRNIREDIAWQLRGHNKSSKVSAYKLLEGTARQNWNRQELEVILRVELTSHTTALQCIRMSCRVV